MVKFIIHYGLKASVTLWSKVWLSELSKRPVCDCHSSFKMNSIHHEMESNGSWQTLVAICKELVDLNPLLVFTQLLVEGIQSFRFQARVIQENVVDFVLDVSLQSKEELIKLSLFKWTSHSRSFQHSKELLVLSDE